MSHQLKNVTRTAMTASLLARFTIPAQALEYPIGATQNMAGMDVAAVYLQAVDMRQDGHMKKASETDIHLEADIHASCNNPNSFPKGTWKPYLPVKHKLTKPTSGKVIKGGTIPMMGSDGPHYGNNIKLKGSGKYKVKFTVYSPSAPENSIISHFNHHADRATGVPPRFKPFEAEWEFTHAGIGKKGGY